MSEHRSSSHLFPFSFALAWLALPALEYVTLRVLFRALSIPLGWGNWLTDYDLLIPLPVAFILFLYFAPRPLPPLTWKSRPLKYHLGLLAIYLVFTLISAQFGFQLTTLGKALWWALTLLSFGSSLIVLVPLKFIWNAESRVVLIYAAVVASSTVTVTHLVRLYWKPIGKQIARALNGIFDFSHLPIHAWFTKGGIRVAHSEFNLHIGHNCGGMDGLFLASATLVFLAFRYRRELSFLHYAALITFAWSSVFLLNALRIACIFIIGLQGKRIWGYDTGVSLLMEIFHTYAGWAFYFVGIFSTFRLAAYFHSPRPETQTSLHLPIKDAAH